MTFTPMYDLESLNEAQRREYYLSACEFFGVPPDLNLLAFMYMDSGDGKRNLVLYAKKGATDLIRSNLGISTTKLTKDVGDGYVAWIAEGKDKHGRTEMAVGSASIAGLKGQILATAVMIAQTRATRRMTLQFVGGGLLDESELNETTTDINRAQAPLATMATLPARQPVVMPSTAPGKDITKKEAPEPFSGGSIIPDKVEMLEDMDQPLVQIEPLTKYPNFSELAQTVTDPIVLAAAEDSLKPKKRHRRTRAEMEAARTAEIVETGIVQVETQSPIIPLAEAVSGNTVVVTIAPNSNVSPLQIAVNNSAPPVCDTHKEVMILSFYDRPGGPPGNAYTCRSCCTQQTQQSQSVVQSAVEEVIPELVYPTKEQEDHYRKQLQVYTTDILKTGGMTDGIIWRVRKYTLHLFPDALIENGKMKLTVKQWDHLLDSLDDQNKAFGPKGLVQAINEIAEKG